MREKLIVIFKDGGERCWYSDIFRDWNINNGFVEVKGDNNVVIAIYNIDCIKSVETIQIN